ncbi:hypothetical protein PMAYCL1PPCAC_20830, partial [Pristionchus mayeri]
GKDISCLLSLEAAISDSTDVIGDTGMLLRRILTDFGTFATRLEEDVEDSTKEQLEKMLKSMRNFRAALDMTIDSIKTRVQFHSVARDSKEVASLETTGVEES